MFSESLAGGREKRLAGLSGLVDLQQSLQTKKEKKKVNLGGHLTRQTFAYILSQLERTCSANFRARCQKRREHGRGRVGRYWYGSFLCLQYC